jgi:uncharacterized protein (UPF0261 family)
MSAPTPSPVALVGALDTKHEEYAFVRDRLHARGLPTLLIDVGVLAESRLAADIDRGTVAAAAGRELLALASAEDRNAAMIAMAGGASAILDRLHRTSQISAVLVLGGSNAGYVMSRLAAVLPIGFPKVLVSTVVAGDTRPYLQDSDLIMMYSVVDLAGLNVISRSVLTQAADLIVGVVAAPTAASTSMRVRSVGCSMFGVTTPCVAAISAGLRRGDVEVQSFHANGTGGRTLERLIASGTFAAVADITTELADELFDGVCSAGPGRLTAAARHAVPQVVSVGALDMVNFGPMASVPEQYRHRRLFGYNPAVTLMRTDPDDCARLGAEIAERLNRATAFTEVHVPVRGFSQISGPGGPFHDPRADAALIDSLRDALRPDVPLHLHDAAINDQHFADHILQALGRALDTEKGNPDA